MAAKRTRFCPQGHDKDIVGVAVWIDPTFDSAPNTKRQCKACKAARKKRYLERLRNEKRIKEGRSKEGIPV